MKQQLYLKTLFLLFALMNNGFAAEEGETVTLELGKKFRLVSSHLGETRDVLVRLPEGYATSTDQYPVIYVLDGESHFHHVGNAVKILKELRRMPDAIVVAIPNNGNRLRDLTFEKEPFKRFLTGEVVPMIDKRYRTSDRKVLFGHSMAGAFSLFLLTAEPDAFDGFIAASPGVQGEDAALLTLLPNLFAQNKHLEKSVYLTRTSVAEEGPGLTEAFTQLVALLKKTAPPKLRWQQDVIPHQSHMSTPYLTAYEGLSMVFRDYQFPSLANHQEYKQFGGWEGIEKHYAQRSEKYGTAKEVPSGAYGRIGWMLIDDQQGEAGLQLFRANLKKNPQSPRAFAMLGNAQAELKQTEEALKTFQAGLELAKETDAGIRNFITRRIEALTKELNKEPSP